MFTTILELKKGDLIAIDVEFSNMELIAQVIKLIVEITKSLGAQRYITNFYGKAFIAKIT